MNHPPTMTEPEPRAADALSATPGRTLSGASTRAADRSYLDPLDGNGAVTAPPVGLRATKPVALDGPVTHSCGAWWTGTRAAHCGSCHLTFSSTTAFDEHQRGGVPGAMCRNPAEAGLVPVDKPYGVLWSWPGNGHNPHARAA